MARTVTLDEDVEARLIAEAQKTGADPQQLANDVLRRELPTSTVQPKPFKVRPRKMGAMTGLDIDCTARLLDTIEGPNWK